MAAADAVRAGLGRHAVRARQVRRGVDNAAQIVRVSEGPASRVIVPGEDQFDAVSVRDGVVHFVVHPEDVDFKAYLLAGADVDFGYGGLDRADLRQVDCRAAGQRLDAGLRQ